ncbi:MAG: hypothetical protein JXA08_09080 [Methanomicrobiaceae archaeon]|nr:hypothetical protein [Methanomicrobiaceae archaeon]
MLETFTHLAERAAEHPQIIRRPQLCKGGFIATTGPDRSTPTRRWIRVPGPRVRLPAPRKW